MSQVFALPDLGEGLTEAEILEWLVGEGDQVSIDQPVVTVETAKASVEVPCPYAGTVATLHGAVGDTLAVGQPLITVAGATGAGGEQYRAEERAGISDGSGDGSSAPERPLIGYGAGEARPRRHRPTRPPRPDAPHGAPTPAPNAPHVDDHGPAGPPHTSGGPDAAPPHASGGQAVRVISPLVRALAVKRGIDLTSLTPTGPGGVLRRADVEQASSRPGAATGAESAIPTTDERLPITGLTKVMVDRLTTSRREIPDATTWVDADATALLEVKDALKAARPDAGIGVLPLLARVVVAGLRAYPALNSSVDIDAGEIVRHGQINLGFAAQSPRGLVVPVVHGAGSMTTAELAAALRALTEKAREGKVSPAELTGGTFTLNNYGVFGVDGSTPIINHPEAAMLGVGRIIDKPWAYDGQVALRKVTQLSFTFDHRVCDGGTAGGFLRFVADCVEQPAVLLAGL